MSFFRIPQGTIVYRAADTIEDPPQPQICEDTDKYGAYFSTHWWLSIAKVLEENRSLQLSRYGLTRDLDVLYGKYTFREMTPGKFFDVNGNLRPNVPLDPVHHQSHFDPNVFPLEDNLPRPASWIRNAGHGELFVASKDLDALAYMDSTFLEYDHVRDILERGDEFILDDAIERRPTKRLRSEDTFGASSHTRKRMT